MCIKSHEIRKYYTSQKPMTKIENSETCCTHLKLMGVLLLDTALRVQRLNLYFNVICHLILEFFYRRKERTTSCDLN